MRGIAAGVLVLAIGLAGAASRAQAQPGAGTAASKLGAAKLEGASDPATAITAWAARATNPTSVRLERIDRRPGELTVHLRAQGGATARLILGPRPANPPPGVGVPLPSLLVLTDPRTPPPELAPALAALTAELRRLDRGQFRVDPGQPPLELHGGHGGRRDPGGVATPGLLPVTWALLALCVLALPWGLLQAWRLASAGAGRNAMILLGISPIAAWLLRAVAPHRLVMVYFGYLHVDQAASLESLPRYGAATTLLDHALFRIAPTHHASVQWLHTFLGSLTILPLAALTAALWRACRPGHDRTAGWAGAAAAWALALMPLSVLDHGTESMLVPAFLWWALAVVLADRHVATGRAGDLAGATILLALCGLSRPDAMLAGPLALAALLLGLHGPAGLAVRWRTLGLAAIALVALLVPGIAFVQARAAEDVALGNLPNLGGSFIAELPRRLGQGWVVLGGRYFPVAWTALAAAALVPVATRRAAWALWAAALIWAVPMLVDFNETSALRLHAPSALLVALAAALVPVALATGALAWPAAARWRLGLATALGIVALATAAATVPAVFARQISDFDGDFLERVAALARDGRPATYVARGYDDPPDRGIHLFLPRYLLEPGDRWVNVRDYLRDPAHFHAMGAVYAVLGARCHAQPAGDRPSHRFPARHPACEAVCQGRMCRPVLEQALPNVGERAFDWYPPPQRAPGLAVGLYEVSPHAAR